MAKYESNIKMTPAPVEKVYQVLSNLESFDRLRNQLLQNEAWSEKVKEMMEKESVDSSQLDKLKDVQITADRISAPVPMMGEFAMEIVEREENKCIKFQTTQSPIEATLWIQTLPTSEVTNPMGGPGTKMRLTLKADMNPMIKMMIGNKLEAGIEKFADMLAMLPYSQM